MKKILLFILGCAVCTQVYAKEVNVKYSYKDFMNQNFKTIPVEEFNNTIIIGSCFYQEGDPDADIFPDGIVGVDFKKCNLDNVLIKEGMAVDVTNSKKKIKVQNDLADWIVEKKQSIWKAKEPLNKAKFIELGISIDPNNIPVTKLDKPLTESKVEEIILNPVIN